MLLELKQGCHKQQQQACCAKVIVTCQGAPEVHTIWLLLVSLHTTCLMVLAMVVVVSLHTIFVACVVCISCCSFLFEP